MMLNYVPNLYKNNILDINYDKLKQLNIKLIAFDLIITILKNIIMKYQRIKKLFNKLKKILK